eukprot:4304828-Pyramimonas_sp.AAC.1
MPVAGEAPSGMKLPCGTVMLVGSPSASGRKSFTQVTCTSHHNTPVGTDRQPASLSVGRGIWR